MAIKLEFGETEYRLVVNGEESETVEYGESLEFKGHIAHVDKENDEVVSCLSDWVFRLGPAVSGVEQEDVDFEGDEEDEDEEDTVEVSE